MSFHLESEAEASVENAAVGWLRFFVDSASIKYKNSSGTVFTLATGVTEEKVEDIIASIIVGGNGINAIYDDPGNTLTFSVEESQLDHTLLQNIGVNSHVQIDNHIAANNNPHSTTAAQVGADPAGTAIAEAANAITNHENGTDPHPQYQTAAESQAQVDSHANMMNNPHGVTKDQVGLGNVDNTSDANKPVSTAQQAALDLKYNASNPSGFETPSQLNTRDTGNRNRSNHTGTQPASSISDLTSEINNALVAYLDRKFNQDNAASSNTNSTTLQNRFNVSFNLAFTAQYRVTLSFEHSTSVNWNDFRSEFLVNGSVVRSTSTQQATGDDQRFSSSITFLFNATAGTNTFLLRHGVETQGTSTIYNHCLTVERYI